MNKFFQYVFSIIYASFIGGILLLLFKLITPFILGLSWFGLLLEIILGIAAITTIVPNIATLAAMPMTFIVSNNRSKINYDIVMLLYAATCIYEILAIDISFSLIQWFLALILCVITFGSYLMMIFANRMQHSDLL